MDICSLFSLETGIAFYALKAIMMEDFSSKKVDSGKWFDTFYNVVPRAR